MLQAYPFREFRKRSLITFPVMITIDRKTNEQTNKQNKQTKTKYDLLGGGNDSILCVI